VSLQNQNSCDVLVFPSTILLVRRKQVCPKVGAGGREEKKKGRRKEGGRRKEDERKKKKEKKGRKKKEERRRRWELDEGEDGKDILSSSTLQILLFVRVKINKTHERRIAWFLL
jgi:hypothetical protein